MESLSQANSAFALDLYRTVSESSPDTNLFFSLLSVSAALAMIYLGARGTTAEEMTKVMSFSSVSDVHTHFKALISDINSPKSSYILKLANRLFGEKSFNFLPELFWSASLDPIPQLSPNPITCIPEVPSHYTFWDFLVRALEEFLDSTLKLYQADMQPVDFIGASEETRKLINLWVEEKTESKIKDLLKPGMVDDSTQLVLVNAIYFMGSWEYVFKTEDTKEMPFKNETRPVQMMYQREEFPYKYVPEYKLKVLELPYLEDELSMLVLLPDETQDGSDPLQKLERELTVDKLNDWTQGNMHGYKDIVVHLPKFKLEEEYSLVDTLSKMGMSSLFQASAADLTGMSSDGGLFVSSAIHKAFVEVNEKGTEAAAATFIRMVACSYCYIPDQHFMADHPFLFFIRHNPTKSILFLGRFRGPQ